MKRRKGSVRTRLTENGEDKSKNGGCGSLLPADWRNEGVHCTVHCTW